MSENRKRPAPDPGPPRRTRRAGAVLLVAILAAGAGALWWWAASHRAAPPLAPGWDARVVVLAGSGTPGMRDGDRFQAKFSDPFGVAAAADGSVYVSDAGASQRIRRIAADGAVTTLAGSAQGYADGPAAAARFSTPSGLAIGPDSALYVADTGNNVIRRISSDGVVSTLAGALVPGYADGASREARFDGPVGVAIDAGGRVLVADTYNDRIRAVEVDGRVVTIAGSGRPGYQDGPAASARFDTPCGLAVDRAGNIYVADSGNGLVRLIAPSGDVSTIAPLPDDGLARPFAVTVTPDDVVYVTDDRGRIIEIVPGVAARIVAGSRAGFADGAGADARFRSLTGIALVGEGRLVVVDARSAIVRLLSAVSRQALRPPPPPAIKAEFDAAAFSRAPLLWPIDPMDGPFEVTGTLGEPRGGEGKERFHAGVDIHADEGVIVRAIRSATVTSPLAAGDFGTLNESIRVGPIAYVHVRVGRDRGGALVDPARFKAAWDEAGAMTYVRVRRGARFSTGDPVGTANDFNHVHLNVGWPGEEHNPLLFRFVRFEDRVPPTIVRGGIRLFREDGTLLTTRVRGRLVVEGRVRIVADVWDQVDGNAPRRRLGLYALGYQILQGDGTPAPGFERPLETIRFDRLIPGTDAARIVYASGSGIPFYGQRSTRLLYVVTNTLAAGVASMGVWDTGRLLPGPYTLRVLAADAWGNAASANRDLAVTIGPGVSP